MFNRKTAVLLATVSTLSLSGAAQADFKITSISPGNQDFKITYTGTPYVNTTVSTGAYNLTGIEGTSDEGLNFKAFCVDIFNTIGVGYTYEMWESSPTPAWSDAVTQRVNYLFDNYNHEIEDNAAAFQLTLWELINDNPNQNNTGNLGNGKFTAKVSYPTSNAWEELNSIDLANSMIHDVLNNSDGYWESALYEFTFYDPKGKDLSKTHQMLIGWTDKISGGDIPSENPIPEPGSLALLLAGLFAIGYTSTRKQSEEDNNYFAAMA